MSGEPPSSAAQIISKSGSLVSDIDSLKVPELKKRLKSLGLSTSGNKAELIERLHEAYLSEKDGSLDGGLDDESLEEEALLNDDPDQSALSETEFKSSWMELQTSPEKEVPKPTPSASSKPLKKRAIAHVTETADETPKTPKPIVLKRNNYPTIEAPKPAEKKDHPPIEAPKSEKSIKADKVASHADKLQLRAKRFNITEVKANSAADLKAKGTKPAAVNNGTSDTKNLDVLRKRAERFGENVSTVMKQLETQEKILKRKLKFTGDSTVAASSSTFTSKTLTSEQERKKKRLERFGLVK